MTKDLFSLIRSGDCDGLHEAVAGDATVANTKNALDESLLHLAASMGSDDMAKCLLEAGANPDSDLPPSHGRPIVYALWHGHEDVVRRLISAGASIGDHELHAAIRKCKALIDPLVEAGAYDARVDGRDDLLWQGLRSIAANDGAALKEFLQRNPDVIGMSDNQGCRLIHEAAAIADPAIVSLLIQEGSDISACDDQGRTPLEVAASHDRVETVSVLVGAGADVSVLPDPRTYQFFSRPHKDGMSPVDGAGTAGLTARHDPNPCDEHESVLYAKKPFDYIWFYRSFVENRTKAPLRVVWFEHFELWDGTWWPGNIKTRPLNGLDFSQWYGESEQPLHRGRIAAGRFALCKVNWHGSHGPKSVPHKWAYRAVDDEGNAHFAEAVIDCVPYPST